VERQNAAKKIDALWRYVDAVHHVAANEMHSVLKALVRQQPLPECQHGLRQIDPEDVSVSPALREVGQVATRPAAEVHDRPALRQKLTHTARAQLVLRNERSVDVTSVVDYGYYRRIVRHHCLGNAHPLTRGRWFTRRHARHNTALY